MTDKAIPVNWHDEFLRAEAALSEAEHDVAEWSSAALDYQRQIAQLQATIKSLSQALANVAVHVRMGRPNAAIAAISAALNSIHAGVGDEQEA